MVRAGCDVMSSLCYKVGAACYALIAICYVMCAVCYALFAMRWALCCYVLCAMCYVLCAMRCVLCALCGGRCVLRHEVCVVQDGPDSRAPITNDRRERSKPPSNPAASHCPPSALPVDAFKAYRSTSQSRASRTLSTSPSRMATAGSWARGWLQASRAVTLRTDLAVHRPPRGVA